MKRCPRCKSRKNPFGTNRARPDNQTFYCRPCNREITNTHRALHPELRAKRKAKRAEQRAFRAILAAQAKAEREKGETQRLADAVQLRLFVEDRIRLLTKDGASRNFILGNMQAPTDLICDTLARLWSKGELVIKRYGEARYFYLRRAA